MANAVLEMEVDLGGTDKAASQGLDAVAKSSAGVGRAASVTTSSTSTLTSTIGGLSSGALAANAAQTALAQLMSGNFVGAFKSAAVAVKSLWGAMLSNPITAIIAGIAAAGLAVVAYMNHVKAAAEEQRKINAGVRDFKQLMSELAGTDTISNNAAYIANQEKTGSTDGLKEWRDKTKANTDALAAKAMSEGMKAQLNPKDERQQEAAARSLEIYQKSIAILGMYEEAIARVDAANATAAEVAAANAEKIKEAIASIEEKQREAEDKALADANEASADALEQSLKDADKKIEIQKAYTEKLKALRKELADYEIAEMRRVAAESQAKADAAQGAANKALEDLMNPADAGKEEKEAEKAARREALKLKARMSGNSVEAQARRQNLSSAQLANDVQQNIHDVNQFNMAQADAAEKAAQLARLEGIRAEVSDLNAKLS